MVVYICVHVCLCVYVCMSRVSVCVSVCLMYVQCVIVFYKRPRNHIQMSGPEYEKSRDKSNNKIN